MFNIKNYRRFILLLKAMIKKATRANGPKNVKLKNPSLDSDIESSETEFWNPKYLDADWLIESEYQNEWKEYLATKNFEQISDLNELEKQGFRFMFYGIAIIQCIFIICNMLKQPPEVKYLAVDIFDRFLILHFFQTVDKATEGGNRNTPEWDNIVDRIFSQALLRILSVIQLAAKYSCNSKTITIKSVQELMNGVGRQYRYTKENIIKSEARVYQTLNFNIPMVTPLTYIEMFIEDFHNQKATLCFPTPLQKFLNITIDVLDVAVIYHKEIYNQLWWKLTGSYYQPPREKVRFAPIEGDYIYLASGVICTAAILEDPSTELADRLTSFMSSTTQYKKEEMELLGNIIKEIILRD